MKSVFPSTLAGLSMSHPVRGAWIEIIPAWRMFSAPKSHPVRGAWIEIGFSLDIGGAVKSHPVRGAWIEIDGRV